ncbi:phosphoribulokinase/uridine kinase [Azospirillum formosense]|uniref:phosphoribulokinase n=1 Tax=Azospirillum formosense TaxID=861533 RepID=A0ABX2L6Y0_9PROT|nr:phosphoribulokinase/uridine kinase [Azospirillum formosense]MBY3757630.1 phosphoribulokinase/uridine kinase [Azospirillum formosense]NUB22220.1 phosphoribulokinase/uridine kinase [Azospirillum formosense]
MALIPSGLARDPWFLLGLGLRGLLLAVLVPGIQETWFVPFLTETMGAPSLDPWSSFLAHGGDALSFPYGPVMLAAFLPLTLIGWLAGLPFGAEMALAGLGLRLTLLAFDVAGLLVLRRMFPERRALLTLAYWLSPLVFYVTYWHGQLDIVPVAIMMGAFHQIGKRRFRQAGLLLALACAAKFSMLLALPFFGIYLWQNKRLRSGLKPFAKAFGGVAALLGLLPLLSPGYRDMVLETPETAKLYWLALPQSEGLVIYLVPLAFSLMLYATWRLRRTNFSLLLSMTGVTFLTLVLMTPASPGWYLWAFPFLVVYQISADRAGYWLVGLFSVMAVPLLALTTVGSSLPLLGIATPVVPEILSLHARSVWLTMVIAVGCVLGIRMFRNGIQHNDYFRLSRKPLAIGIAGDSGAGKDTLAAALEGLFGRHSVQHILGDGYHKWARGAPMWRAVTHLNPRANDLPRLTENVLATLDGREAVGQIYDHHTGRFSPPITLSSNDVLVVSGLHTLLPPALLERLNVRIFLETDEELRLFWKMRRDVAKRGHDPAAVRAQMARRQPDSDAYIRPQMANADLVFQVAAVNPGHLAGLKDHPVPLKLRVLIRDSLYPERLAKALIAICGVQLDMDMLDEGRTAEMIIEGDVWAEDIGLAAANLVPNLDELLDVTPLWHSNVLGVMQLIVLMQIDENLRRRIAK